MKYQIIRTATADEQLRDTIFYIAEDSGSIDIALDYLDKLEHAIHNLEDFPYLGVSPKYATLRRQNYLVLATEKHLVFYKVDKMHYTVTIYAVIDGRREYRNLL
jgi:toxin ParE1/3/4